MMMILNHWVIVRDKRMILRQVSFRKENDNDEVEKKKMVEALVEKMLATWMGLSDLKSSNDDSVF